MCDADAAVVSLHRPQVTPCGTKHKRWFMFVLYETTFMESSRLAFPTSFARGLSTSRLDYFGSLYILDTNAEFSLAEVSFLVVSGGYAFAFWQWLFTVIYDSPVHAIDK